MTVLAVLLLSAVAAPAQRPGGPGSAPGADPPRPSPGTGRTVTVDQVAAGYRELLPGRGVLAGGGGFVSTTWRVVVDLDAATLAAVRSDAQGAPIAGDLGTGIERALPGRVVAELEDLAGRVVANAPEAQRVFSADSVGVLIVASGDEAYVLMPAGPITEGVAARLHALLHALAWPAD